VNTSWVWEQLTAHQITTNQMGERMVATVMAKDRKSQLQLFTEGYDRQEKLMKLLYEGNTPRFKESFRASGLKNCKQSPMYRSHQAQFNHAVRMLLLSGRALVLSLDCLAQHPDLAQRMHMSSIFNVDKVRSVAGRTVFDASADNNSLNDGADRERVMRTFQQYIIPVYRTSATWPMMRGRNTGDTENSSGQSWT